VVRLLLAAGAHADARKVDGATPLFAAAQEGHAAVVAALLAAGADAGALHTQTHSAARQHDRRFCVRAGLGMRASGTGPRAIAARNGHAAVAARLPRPPGGGAELGAAATAELEAELGAFFGRHEPGTSVAAVLDVLRKGAAQAGDASLAREALYSLLAHRYGEVRL
jgi:ankyrin repeat protein